jgi:hypothetical protein
MSRKASRLPTTVDFRSTTPEPLGFIAEGRSVGFVDAPREVHNSTRGHPFGCRPKIALPSGWAFALQPQTLDCDGEIHNCRAATYQP